MQFARAFSIVSPVHKPRSREMERGERTCTQLPRKPDAQVETTL